MMPYYFIMPESPVTSVTTAQIAFSVQKNFQKIFKIFQSFFLCTQNFRDQTQGSFFSTEKPSLSGYSVGMLEKGNEFFQLKINNLKIFYMKIFLIEKNMIYIHKTKYHIGW